MTGRPSSLAAACFQRLRRLPHSRLLLCGALSFLVLCGTVLAAQIVVRGSTSSACNLYASPSGSASGSGSASAPLNTLTALDKALAPGQTGCLQPGIYGGLTAWHQIDTDGTASRRITVRSVPGGVATIIGYVDIEASYTTVENLRIDGVNTLYDSPPTGAGCPTHVSQPLIIAGHNDILQYDDYFQSIPALRSNGIGVGFWGDANGTVIRYNTIHDVGKCQAYDHLIYLAHGNGTVIYDNWMWDDAHGRGVQLYPGPTNAWVFDNVIDHAGEGFAVGDEPGTDVVANHIFHNVVLNSVGLPSENIPGEGIHDYYGGVTGFGNSFYANDVFADPGGIGHYSSALSVYSNTTVNPGLVNPSAHDYAAAFGSPVAGWGLWNGVGVASAALTQSLPPGAATQVKAALSRATSTR